MGRSFLPSHVNKLLFPQTFPHVYSRPLLSLHLIMHMQWKTQVVARGNRFGVLSTTPSPLPLLSALWLLFFFIFTSTGRFLSDRFIRTAHTLSSQRRSMHRYFPPSLYLFCFPPSFCSVHTWTPRRKSDWQPSSGGMLNPYTGGRPRWVAFWFLRHLTPLILSRFYSVSSPCTADFSHMAGVVRYMPRHPAWRDDTNRMFWG